MLKAPASFLSLKRDLVIKSFLKSKFLEVVKYSLNSFSEKTLL
jgi:hypothetical protein